VCKWVSGSLLDANIQTTMYYSNNILLNSHVLPQSMSSRWQYTGKQASFLRLPMGSTKHVHRDSCQKTHLIFLAIRMNILVTKTIEKSHWIFFVTKCK
jgi:hypothetical protein